jgi:5-dehydro-2-deoxygluconokinase
VAKCLVSHHPDDEAELRDVQMAQLVTLQQACIATDREFLIEVIPPREMAAASDTLARALEQIYAAGVKPDWWKLPPPETDAAWRGIASVIEKHDRHCRGVLLLGLAASEDTLFASFQIAAPHPLCKGFAVGRSIFAESAAAWFKGAASDDEVVADVAARYARLIALWQRARA